MSNEAKRTKKQRTTLLPAERYARIQEMVRMSSLVRVEAVADDLGVSLETVRRDVLFLEAHGLLRRVYGGVANIADHSTEPSFDSRVGVYPEAKRAMGIAAADLIAPGATVVFDLGTSVSEVARNLNPAFVGRVITTSLVVAAELASRAGIELVVTGGVVRAGDLAVSGTLAREAIERYFSTIAFIGSGGVDLSGGLTDYHSEEAAIRRAIIARSAEVWILADSSKFGIVAPVLVSDLTNIRGIITDGRLDGAVAEAYERAGIRVLVAPPVADAARTEQDGEN